MQEVFLDLHFLTKQLITKDAWVILGQFFSELTQEDSMAGFSKTQLLSTLHVCLCRLRLMSSGIELSTVVFSQHVHPS
jgi:hypothetical protein